MGDEIGKGDELAKEWAASLKQIGRNEKERDVEGALKQKSLDNRRAGFPVKPPAFNIPPKWAPSPEDFERRFKESEEELKESKKKIEALNEKERVRDAKEVKDLILELKGLKASLSNGQLEFGGEKGKSRNKKLGKLAEFAAWRGLSLSGGESSLAVACGEIDNIDGAFVSISTCLEVSKVELEATTSYKVGPCHMGCFFLPAVIQKQLIFSNSSVKPKDWTLAVFMPTDPDQGDKVRESLEALHVQFEQTVYRVEDLVVLEGAKPQGTEVLMLTQALGFLGIFLAAAGGTEGNLMMDAVLEIRVCLLDYEYRFTKYVTPEVWDAMIRDVIARVDEMLLVVMTMYSKFKPSKGPFASFDEVCFYNRPLWRTDDFTASDILAPMKEFMNIENPFGRNQVAVKYNWSHKVPAAKESPAPATVPSKSTWGSCLADGTNFGALPILNMGAVGTSVCRRWEVLGRCNLGEGCRWAACHRSKGVDPTVLAVLVGGADKLKAPHRPSTSA